MEEFNAREQRSEMALPGTMLAHAQGLDGGYPAYVGLDVPQETIAVAVAKTGREAPVFRCKIANRPA